MAGDVRKDITLVLTFDDKGSAQVKKVIQETSTAMGGLQQKTEEANKKVRDAGRGAVEGSQGFEKLKNSVKGTALQMAAGMGIWTSFSQVIGFTIRQIKDIGTQGMAFAGEMQRVAVATGNNAESMKKFKTELLNLSPALGSVHTMSTAFYNSMREFSHLGTERVLQLIRVAAQSAAAGFTTTDVAANALTDTIKGYRLQLEDATHISDVLVAATKSQNITYEELARTITKLTPMAYQAGISFSELIGTFLTLVDSGVDSQMAMMQMRVLLQSLIKPSSTVKKAADELGISFSASGVQAKGFVQWLIDLQKATGGNINVLDKFFGSARSLTGVLSLTTSHSKEWKESVDKLTEAYVKGGQTQDAFGIRMQSVSFWITTAKEAFNRFKISVFEGLIAPLKESISKTTDTKKAIDDFTVKLVAQGLRIGQVVGSAVRFAIKNITDLVELLKTVATVWSGIKLVGWASALLKMAQAAAVSGGAISGLSGIVMGFGVYLLQAAAVVGTFIAAFKFGELIGKWTGLNIVVEDGTTKILKWFRVFEGITPEWADAHIGATTRRAEMFAKASELVGKKVADWHTALLILKNARLTGVDLGTASLNEWVDTASKADKKAGVFGSTIKTLPPAVKPTEDAFTAMARKLLGLDKIIDDAGTSILDLKSKLGIKEFDDYRDTITDATRALERYKGRLPIEDQRKLNEQINDALYQLGKVPEKFADIEDKANKTATSLDSFSNKLREISKANAEFSRTLSSGFLDTQQGLIDKSQELYDKLKTAMQNAPGTKATEKAESPVNKALREDMEYWTAMSKSVEDAIQATISSYTEKQKLITEHYDEEKRKFDEFVDEQRREIEVVSETEILKQQIKKATSVEEILNLKTMGAARLRTMKADGDREIDAGRNEALKKLQDWASIFIEPHLADLRDMNEKITGYSLESRDNIIKHMDQLNAAGETAANKFRLSWETAFATIGAALAGLSDIFKTKNESLTSSISAITAQADNDIAKSPAKAAEIRSAANRRIAEINKQINRNEALGGISQAAGMGFSAMPAAFKDWAANKDKYQAQGISKTDVYASALTPAAGMMGGALGQLISGKKNTMAGTGSSIGGALGGLLGPVGGIVGSALGGLLGGLFSSKPKKTEEQRLEEQFTKQVDEAKKAMSKYGDISDETAKKIAEDRKKMSGGAAEMKNFADVIKDVGVNQKNVNSLWQGATGIFDQFKQGGLSAADATKAAGESFTELLKGAQDLGTEGSAAMVNFINRTKESGLKVKEVTEYINNQLGIVKAEAPNAAKGLELMAKGPLDTEDRMARLERQAVATFNAMIANGANFSEAMTALGPALDVIMERYKKMGKEGGAGIKELMKIREVTVANQDLFDAISGNLGVMNALANTGSMTQQSFTDAAMSTQDYYNQLITAGLSGDQALAQMKPTLQRLAFLSKEQGFAVDETTQKLIDQSGANKDMAAQQLSTNDVLLGGFGEIIKALGGTIPDAMKDSMDKMKKLGSSGSDAAAGIGTGVATATGAMQALTEATSGSTGLEGGATGAMNFLDKTTAAAMRNMKNGTGSLNDSLASTVTGTEHIADAMDVMKVAGIGGMTSTMDKALDLANANDIAADAVKGIGNKFSVLPSDASAAVGGIGTVLDAMTGKLGETGDKVSGTGGLSQKFLDLKNSGTGDLTNLKSGFDLIGEGSAAAGMKISGGEGSLEGAFGDLKGGALNHIADIAGAGGLGSIADKAFSVGDSLDPGKSGSLGSKFSDMRDTAKGKMGDVIGYMGDVKESIMGTDGAGGAIGSMREELERIQNGDFTITVAGGHGRGTTGAEHGFDDVVTGPRLFYVEPGITERVKISRNASDEGFQEGKGSKTVVIERPVNIKPVMVPMRELMSMMIKFMEEASGDERISLASKASRR